MTGRHKALHCQNDIIQSFVQAGYIAHSDHVQSSITACGINTLLLFQSMMMKHSHLLLGPNLLSSFFLLILLQTLACKVGGPTHTHKYNRIVCRTEQSSFEHYFLFYKPGKCSQNKKKKTAKMASNQSDPYFKLRSK